jgi:NAD(P)-dependent dehydrogenase (short-subunit alcohol dehydrogenase family)
MDRKQLFHGKTILVTGASSGIGRAVTFAVAVMGAAVVAVGRRSEILEELVDLLPGAGHRREVVDLTVAEDRAKLVQSVGVCHGLVHAAGCLKLQPFAFIQERTLRESQGLNYEAPVLLTQALLRGKRVAGGGSIVFISSVAARRGTKGHATYSGSKAALEASGRCLALEVAGQGIRVNCVAPGMVRTAMAEEAASALGDEAMRRHEDDYPLGFGQPEDVASAVRFLLSDEARWITGTTLVIDGGFTAR